MSRFVCLVLLAACSGSATQTPPPVTPTPPEVAPDAAVVATTATRAECEQLVTHVVDLAAIERTDAVAGDREKVRASLAGFVDECVTQPVHQVQCGVRATTLADVQRCSGDAK